MVETLTDSWKKGAISGLIAGIIAGIVKIVFSNIAIGIEVSKPEYVFGSLSLEMHLLRILIYGSVWGVIFGVLFAVFYDLIPKKGYMKGFLFGLILWLISVVRPMSFMAVYGWSYVAGFIFISFFVLSIYGIILGILFKKNLPLESITYNFGNGVKAGIIAGLIGGASVVITGTLGQWILNLWVIVPGIFSGIVAISQARDYIGLNVIWGCLQGIIFARIYDLIPGKGISKGLMYGGLLFLIAVIYFQSYSFTPDYLPINAVSGFLGLVQAIVFGLVLGYLYKKE